MEPERRRKLKEFEKECNFTSRRNLSIYENNKPGQGGTNTSFLTGSKKDFD
jgi:hypothetical protein